MRALEAELNQARTQLTMPGSDAKVKDQYISSLEEQSKQHIKRVSDVET